MNSFGKKLAKLRKRCRISSGEKLTQAKLTHELESLGVLYDKTNISNWERDISQPPKEVMIILLKILVDHGGLKTPEEANELNNLLDRRDFTLEELKQINSDWQESNLISRSNQPMGTWKKSSFLIPTALILAGLLLFALIPRTSTSSMEVAGHQDSGTLSIALEQSTPLLDTRGSPVSDTTSITSEQLAPSSKTNKLRASDITLETLEHSLSKFSIIPLTSLTDKNHRIGYYSVDKDNNPVPFKTSGALNTDCQETQEPETYTWYFSPEISNPNKVYFMHQGSWMLEQYTDKQVGLIELAFSNGKKQVVELRVGENIRDWSIENSNAVREVTHSSTIEVDAIKTLAGLARIDVLTIEISDDLKDGSLSSIQISDTTKLTTQGENPCFHILGLTIENVENVSIQQEILVLHPTIDLNRPVPTPLTPDPPLTERIDEIWGKFGIQDANRLGDFERTETTNYSRQTFESGVMIWLESMNSIWVISKKEDSNSLLDSWAQFEDTWDASVDPEIPIECENEVDLILGPRYGFGKLWCSSNEVRQTLRNPTGSEPQQGQTRFWSYEGGIIIYVPVDEQIWVLLSTDNDWKVYSR